MHLNRGKLLVRSLERKQKLAGNMQMDRILNILKKKIRHMGFITPNITGNLEQKKKH